MRVYESAWQVHGRCMEGARECMRVHGVLLQVCQVPNSSVILTQIQFFVAFANFDRIFHVKTIFSLVKH